MPIRATTPAFSRPSRNAARARRCWANCSASSRTGRRTPKRGATPRTLFQKGVDKIAKKTGEEAVELVIAAKNGDKEEIVGECADLFYHTLVLLADAGVKLSDVCAELEKRHQ